MNWVGSIFCGLLFLGSSFCVAEQSKTGSEKTTTKKNEKENINLIMVQFSNHIMALEPFIVSNDKFNDPTNNTIITEHLKQMIELSKKASHSDKVQSSLGLKFSRQLLEEHLTETERVFRLGNREYAHWMLNSTANICLSCHTQIPGVERNYDVLAGKDKNMTPFDRAELNFTFRNFDQALELYDDIIRNYPKNNTKIDRVEAAVRRKLTYFVRVKQDPESAIKGIKKNLLNKELPATVKKNLNAWISQLKSWKKVSTPDVKTATPEEVREYVKKLMGPDLGDKQSFSSENLITYLRVSGLLYQYLSQRDRSDFTAEVLYYLALCDRRLSNDLLYSLADLYLKDCIKEYSKTPIAKKCFTEYKDGVLFSYTGSSGTNIPPDVQKELNTLEELLTSKPK